MVRRRSLPPFGSLEGCRPLVVPRKTTTYYTKWEASVFTADVNGTFYYFGYDALWAVRWPSIMRREVSLGAQLYGPTGSSRYTTGTLPAWYPGFHGAAG